MEMKCLLKTVFSFSYIITYLQLIYRLQVLIIIVKAEGHIYKGYYVSKDSLKYLSIEVL